MHTVLRLLVNRLPNTLAKFDPDLVALEVAGKRLVDVGVVDVDGVEVCLHFEQVEGHHLAAELLRGLVLEEPPFAVVLPVQQLVHLVLLALYLVVDFEPVFQHDLLRCLSPHIDLEELLGGGLDAKQVRLLNQPLLVSRPLAR